MRNCTQPKKVFRMRVLAWIELFWPYVGGIEVRTANFLEALRERGHEVAVITSTGSLSLPEMDSFRGISIRRLPFLDALSRPDLGLFAGTLRAAKDFKQQFQPDIVHIQFTDPSPLFHWMSQGVRPVPTVVTVPISLPDAPAGNGGLAARTLGSASWVVACSKAMLDHTRRQVTGLEGRSSVIYNSLPMPSIEPAPLLDGPPVVLAIGRVVRDKGFDLAIDAMPRVIERFRDARLIIAGDGPERPALEDQAQRLGIASQVQFAGWVEPEQIAHLINQCSLVLMPSRWEEAFGLVALQAMQMARPVVVSKVGGLPEVITDGVTGLAVPKENPAALAEAAIALLSDPVRSVEMGLAGRRRALSTFAFSRFVTEHENLYTYLLQSK
jgi:glycosyltransferase involved in cell wall biosynthesis